MIIQYRVFELFLFMLTFFEYMDEIEFLKRQAERKDMTPREFCIYKIDEYREKLEIVSEDYCGLSDEEFHKKIDQS